MTLFPVSYRDADGRRLHGGNDYVVHFASGQFPRARNWRISLYDLDGFFCENDVRRYGIGNFADGLLLNADDSLTLYIQHASPGMMKEPNWLPAPLAEFFLVLRLYQPDERVWRGVHGIPAVKKVSREFVVI